MKQFTLPALAVWFCSLWGAVAPGHILLAASGNSPGLTSPDTVVVVNPVRFDLSGLTGAVFAESLALTNLTDSDLEFTVSESGEPLQRQTPGSFAPQRTLDVWAVVRNLRRMSRNFVQPASGPQRGRYSPVESPLAFTTIITDARNENALGGADVYRVDHQVRTFFGTTYHDFRVVLGDLPDTNLVLFLSIDTDQDFGTGAFPTPAGLGLTSRDIGSEREILLDASGIIIDSLTGWGRIPAGLIINTENDSIVGFPFLLTVSRDSVLTIATNAFNLGIQQGWLGDNDGNMSAGVAAVRFSLNANPLPDFAPALGHGTIGVETNVTWISEQQHRLFVPAGQTSTLSITMLASNEPGTYDADLLLSAAGMEPLTVPIAMTITGYGAPAIQLNASAYSDTVFTGDSTAAVLLVSNNGAVDLVWGILDTARTEWLAVDPQLGLTGPGGSTEVTITLSSDGLTPGNIYEAELFIISNDPANSVLVFPVSLYVHPVTSVAEQAERTNEPSLDQNYPNAFNSTTTISYELTSAGRTTLTVHDLLGRQVAELVNGIEEPGRKTVPFEASGLASGVYYYTLRVKGFVSTKKLILLR